MKLIAVAGSAPALFSGCALPAAMPDDPSFDTVPVEAEYDVLIVGAGIAGLTAAYYLRQQHIRVLESAPYAGGRTLSGDYQGYAYAKGTEYIGQPEGALAAIIADLRVSLKEIPAPMDARFHQGQFYWGDEGIALSHIEQCGLAEYNRFVQLMQQAYADYEDIPDLDLTSELAALDDITVREWFDRLAIPETFYTAYNVTFKGLFGATIAEISALSAIAEIAFDFEDQEPIEDINDLENTPDQQGEYTAAYSCVTGLTEITSAIANHLGDRITFQSTVTRVVRADEQYLVTYHDQAGTPHTLACATLLLAVPAPVALQIAAQVLSAEQQQILQQVPYACYVTIALFSAEPIFTQAFDLAVPDGYFFTDVYDATWVQRYYAGSAGDNVHIISVYVAPQSYNDHSILELSDDELLERVYQHLETIFPQVRHKISGYDIERFRYAYPVMTPGAYKRLSRLHTITGGNLLLAGDYMLYPTFEAAAESGALAAAQVLDW